MCFLYLTSYCQTTDYTIVSPLPNSVIPNGNLFVVVSLNIDIKFRVDEIRIMIDKKLINVNPKIIQNRLSFIYDNSLSDGKHYIEILIRPINEPLRIKNIHWFFYINKINAKDSGGVQFKKQKRWSLSGNIIADNRNEFLSGPGQYLRQEPAFTRTLSINLDTKIKNAHIPFRFFTTTDNNSQIQNRNFFQIGYINRWINISVGDINPSMDRFILTGIRVRGVKTVLKKKTTLLQFYYGILNNKLEGYSAKYTPGSGFIPNNFINDSIYTLPGTYERRMIAGRLETGHRREYFKIGIHAFKAKDVIESIHYGVAPKDNFAGGADLTLKFFKRSLIIAGGVAGSILTSDISYGVADKKNIDSTFDTDLPFDPKSFERVIIVNSSTIPIIPKHFSNGAYFGSLSYSNKTQRFFFEYRKNGPHFVSLGNPFLRNNYEGYAIGESVSLWKRRITLNLNYQNFTNDLSNSLIARMRTNVVNSSVYFAYSRKIPIIMINYSLQNRSTENAIISIAKINERLNTIGFNLNYSKKFWGKEHDFRFICNLTDRVDLIRLNSHTNFYNIIIGIGENISKKINISLDAGKMIIKNYENLYLANINTLAGNIRWQITPQRFFLSGTVSNYLTRATLYTRQSQRFSIIGRFGFKFYKEMGIDVEYGYQPFRDKANSQNNFNEQYLYFRYIYDFKY